MVDVGTGVDVLGVPIVVVTPAVVQVAKEVGLPTKYAGVASMLAAGMMSALIDVATQQGAAIGPDDVARYALAGIVYGLAAAGLYSQVKAVRDGE